MRLVETLLVTDDAELLDAHVTFQTRAGVDFFVAGGAASGATGEVLQRWTDEGRLHSVPEAGGDEALRSKLAELAVADHGADWVLPAEADEFWWPRGESLKEILAAIPKRYTAVQALIRDFAPPAEAGFFAEQMTVRPVLEGAPESSVLLKAVRRAREKAHVPLRAWYPIEILRFRDRRLLPVDEQARASALADDSLVVDTRLRDALRNLRNGGAFEFPTPDVVDDAAYAVECAAVGEVSLEQLERRIDELETKLAELERTFWTRARGRVSRLAGRSGGRRRP
jgi:hypothetical protein